MGDILSFIEKAERGHRPEAGRRDAAQAHRERVHAGGFPRPDAADSQAGPARILLDMMPKVGMLKELKDVKVDEKEISAWWPSSIR
jgi:signal recognition particle GTPase